MLAKNIGNTVAGFHGFGYSFPIDVSGIVVDSKGEPLIGVNVLVKGANKGTATDLDGSFILTDISDDAVLVVSYVGYQTQEVNVEGQSNLKIILQENLQMLDEVVVVGYGTQSRELVTTSVSTLNTKVLENTALGNLGSALQGTIPGLRVTNTSGQPGTAPSILLRGGASINNPGGPLVVIDGVVRTMNDINPADVESISVLKDAASTAMYGARANNGVILITSKKGKLGVSKVTYNVKAGVNSRRPSYPYMNARDMIYYNRIGMLNRNRALEMGNQTPGNVNNTGAWGYESPIRELYSIDKIDGSNRSEFNSLINQGWQWMLDPYYEGDTLVFKDYGTEVYDNSFNLNARTQDHHLEFSGGNDKGEFTSSVGYYDEEGLIVGSKYERLSGRLSGSYNVRDNLNVFGNVSYSNSKRPALHSPESLIFFRSLSIPPTFKPYDKDGNPSSGAGQWDSNPLYWQDKFIRKNDVRRTNFNIGAKLEIIKDLYLNLRGSLYYVDETNESFNKEIKYVLNPVPISSRDAYSQYNSFTQQQHTVTLDYTKSISKHNVQATVGGEYFDAFSFNLGAAGRKAPTDLIYTLNAALERTAITSSKSQYRILSSFGRLSYDYDRKYLMTAVMRYDGISSLADNRWGAFPGISIGWNIHQEKFFQESDITDYITSLKPRISYGINGNISGVGNYEAQGRFGIQSPYDRQAAILNTNIVNKGLKWEKSESIQFGMDIGLMDNKINMSIDYFERTTKDLLTNLSLPSYTGFGSFKTNLGNYLNSGVEFDINTQILQQAGGLNLDIGVNASYVKNRIVKLPYNGNENNRQGGTQVYDPATGKIIWVGGLQEGGKVGDIYAYVQERILRDWNDVNKTVPNRYDEIAQLYGPEAYAKLEDKTGKFPIEPGDVLWADLDGNGVINTLDRAYMGNIFPDWTGGLYSTLSYKKISLYGRFDFAMGHIIYNDNVARSLGQMVGAVNTYELAKEMWSPENMDSDLPAFYWADQPKLNIKRSGLHFSTPDDHNSRFYEKGDYLALRELSLSYLLPTSILSKVGVSNARLHMTGQNLAYFTKYSGNAPELGGSDNGRYPLPTSFVLGLSVSF